MASKERENFYKNSTLIVDHAKDSLVDVLELHVHLSIKSPSFENFINLHRHEIYHLCFNKRRCCQCLPGYVLPVNRVLYPSQLKILLDTYHGVARTCQCPGRRTDFCCCLNVAKPGVTTNVLDITLARCLLINFCDDVFWHSCLTLRSNTLEDFLNQYQHHLYHLANVSTPCCRCPPGYVLPVARPLLDLHQWNVLFNVHALPCALHRNIPGSNICWVLASSGIDVNNLSKDLSSTILEQCCSLRKNIDTLLQMRNNVYGHAKEGRITDVKYRIDKNEIESAILEIAKVCGNETEKKQILMDLEKRSLDETLCIQYQNTMLDQIAKDTQLEEKLNDLAEIVEKVVVKVYGNTEQELTKALIKKPLQDVCCVEGEIACLSCEIIKDETAVTWYKDDVEIIPSTDIILKMHGKIHELSIPRTEMKDGGRYSIKVKQSTSEAKLTVKALISTHLVDRTCLEGSTIVFSCEVSVEDISGIWYKDDSIVVQSNQIQPTVNSRIHQLNIFQSEIKDGGKYVFKIRDKISSAILTVKAVIKKHLENVTCIEDQSLSLVCELAEKDISVTWLKDEKVIEASKNIVPEIDNNAHILKFKKLSKNDDGKYALMAKGKKTEAVVLVIAKSTIPDQILQMDEKDKEMYLEIMKSGTERRYYIRLMIVGENGVGKTCLMRRLLGEDIDDVTSTDGIDVVIRKCKIRISDGQWILNEEDTVKQDRNVRMKRALTDKDSILPEEKIRDKQEESLLEDAPMETTVTPFGNVKGEEIKNVTEIKDIYTGKVMDQKNDVDMQFTNELEEESIAESVPLHTDKDVTLKSEKRVGLLDSLSDVMNVELPKEFFADCDVWDFAGQKEFYATHQTFLTNSAIYLLTADLSKDLSSQIQTKICNVDFGKVGCYIDFWFDTIHCYATTESPDQSVDKPTSDKLEPPIIIVCTGTDKIEGELSKQKDSFVKQLNSILDKQSKRKHITGIQYISNKEPLEKDFVELQSAIVQTATKMSSWGKELPLRWIHLETALDGERDAGSNILPFHLVVKLAKDSSLPTSDNEEIILFLKYQHECGHVIFFKDLPDYIILNPRWLIDAFKCFVSAHQFQGDLLYLDDWKELEETGRLTNKLISRLFEKVPKLKFMEYKEHLLHVLEKFDIIVKPNNIENTTSYYLPCMIKSSSFDVICHNFGVHLPSCHRTSWLLLEFEFLPPAFFNHVLVGYIRQFNVSTESTENGRRLSLYRGIGVFDIVEKGCTKLVICADTNLIAFQIWIYDKKINSTFHDFRHTLTNMVDMLSERYQICCKYKVKLKCSESDYQKAEGRYEYCYKDDKMKSYFCPEHQSGHECLDVFKYWFSDKVDVDGLVIKEEEQANNINADTINMGGDGTNITVKNTDKKEQTNTSVGSSSSSSSENETPENFDKMEKGRHNSDCGQEPGDVDIIKEKISKMKPVSVTEQSNVTSKAKPEMLDVMRCQFRTKNIKDGVFIEDLNNIYVSDIERIAAEHGFSVENVCGDGNCMFHAIALQLLGNKLKSKIGEEKSKELRCNIVEFLKNNDKTPTGEKYSSFLSSVREDERESRWSTYLASMSKPATYGDEIILRAVSHCFNVRIHVLSTAIPERFIKYNSPDISEDSSTVYLGFIDESLHYVRLQPKSSDSSPSGPPEKKKLIDPDQLKLIKEDEGNKILWNEAKKFTKEGAQYPEGYLEAQAKKEEEAGEVTKKEKRKRDDNDSSPSGTPEKKKLVDYEIDPDQLKLIKEDEGNKILWNEAKEFTKEGVQVDGLFIKEEEQESAMTQNSSPQATNNFRQGNNPQTSDYSSTAGTPVSTRVHTIASLSHKQNRWQIRARVTYKSGIAEWSNHHSKGTWFSVHLSDESGEIRATGFNDAVDKYYKMLEVNKIYLISKGTLKTANKKYNNLSKYEITLKADTTVKLCNEDVDSSVKDFTEKNELDSKTPSNTVGNNPQTSDYSSTAGTPVSTRVNDIASLTHKQNRWQIRARVTYKSGIAEWSNHHSKGTWFSVHLSDESGEIRATGFNDAVDKYYKMLEVNKIYLISKGTLKTANKKYNNLSKYEITLKADTTVKLCNEDVDSSVKDFTEKNELDSKTPSNTVEKAASTALLDDNAPPSKIRRMTQEDQRFGISTSSPLPGTSHEKNPEEAYVSKVESEEGLNEKKARYKKITKDEKMLILSSYISLTIKSDWDKLVDNVYKSRNDALSGEMIKNYEDLYKQNKLKDRIKGYIQRVLSNRINETDTDIKGLIKDIQSNESAASPRGVTKCTY